jgi:hypothetical protein
MERKGEAQWEMYECWCLRMQDAMEFPRVIVAWMTRALLSTRIVINGRCKIKQSFFVR